MKKIIYLLAAICISLHVSVAENLSAKPEPGNEAAVLVSIDPTLKFQTLQGWGGSLCWWANIAGNYPDDSIKKICDWITDPRVGLNMNIFRFNIGGGDNPTHDHMRKDGGAMPGYKAGADAPYDWQQDMAQRKVLKQLIASRIANTGKNDLQLVAFSNSPPWWMTKSLCAAGNTDGSDNLREDMYDDFADYLTEVVKYYHDSLGIAFNYIEPFNEPDENWWKAFKGQEGCAFSNENQVTMIRELYKQMDQKNMLPYTQITANDANSIDATLKALEIYKLAGDIVGKVPLVATHSYAGDKRRELYTLTKENQQNLWQSESGPLSVNGTNEFQMLTVSDRIITDLKEMQCTAWIDWQLMADKSPTWGLVVGDYSQKTFTQGIDFYIRAQYSRYLKIGYRVIENSCKNVLTALSPENNELIIVLSNKETTGNKYRFDLSGFAHVGSAKQIMTRANTSHGVKNAESELKMTGNSFSYEALAESVTTFVIPIKK